MKQTISLLGFLLSFNSVTFGVVTQKELLTKLEAGIEQGDAEKVKKTVNKASEQNISIINLELDPLKKGKKALDHALKQEPINKDIILFLLEKGAKLDKTNLKTIFTTNNEQLIKGIFEQHFDSLPEKAVIFEVAMNLEDPSLDYIASKFGISPQDLLLYGIAPKMITGDKSQLKEQAILNKLFAANREKLIKHVLNNYVDDLPGDTFIFKAAMTGLKNPDLTTYIVTKKFNITPDQATTLLFYGLNKKVPIQFIKTLVDQYHASLTAEKGPKEIAAVHKMPNSQNYIYIDEISLNNTGLNKLTPLYLALVTANDEAIDYLLEKLPRTLIGKKRFEVTVGPNLDEWDTTSTRSYYGISLLVKSKKEWQEKLKEIVEEEAEAQKKEKAQKEAQGKEKAQKEEKAKQNQKSPAQPNKFQKAVKNLKEFKKKPITQIKKGIKKGLSSYAKGMESVFGKRKKRKKI